MHPAVTIFRKRHDAFARQTIPCSDDRMTGKRKFVAGSKDAQTTDYFLFLGWQDEDSFRQIHFAGDLLHLFVADTFSLRKHCQRITAKRVIGEHVELKKFVAVQEKSPPASKSVTPA